MKRGCQGSHGRGSGRGGCGGGVGGRGCVVIAKFYMEGLHFLHADIVGSTQLILVHRGRWVEVDNVSEGVGLKGEGHALEYHLLI